MGEGVIDAASLQTADVGLSVAVDIAKEVAKFIFLEPGLKVQHQGILKGAVPLAT